MKIAEFNNEVKNYYAAYKAGIIDQHEFIIALNCILFKNKVAQQTMIGKVVILDKDDKIIKSENSKWILLPDNDLVVDYCLRDILKDKSLPMGVFTVDKLSSKQGTVQYRGERTSSETNKEMFSFINRKIEKIHGQIEKAKELS